MVIEWGRIVGPTHLPLNVRSLRDFLNVHSGETAWVFGKGPSLDRFDMEGAGPLRCAINDTVMAVPNCKYCFANDSISAWRHVYKSEHILFTPGWRKEETIQRRPVFDGFETIVYPDFHGESETRLRWSRERLADEGLAVRSGTLGSVIQILYIMGVAKIVAVGIDGGGHHAKTQQWHTRLRLDHAKDYNRIREGFMGAAKAFSIELEFFGLPPVFNSDGTMNIKIIDNTFIDGLPVKPGDVVSVSPKLANELIACNRAIEYDGAPIEKATAVPLVETSTAEPGKRKTASRK